MTELIFIVCLAASPGHCEEQSFGYLAISPMACAMGAPPLLARWTLEHPGWTVQKWTCRIGGVAHDA